MSPTSASTEYFGDVGVLRSHAAFHARYGRALAASRGSKAGSPEAQAGLLAMESLHKQARALLFLLPGYSAAD